MRRAQYIKRSIPRFIVYCLLTTLGIVWIYPFIWMIASSLKTNSEYIIGGISLIPEELQWENYDRAWNVANFSSYFMSSVVFTTSVVLIVVSLCAMTGYVLGRYHFHGRKLFIVLITATLFMPKGFTIIPIYMLINSIGLNGTMLGMILGETAQAHVLFILLFTAHFSKLPKELEEASEIDGCGFLRTFVQVMLPLSKPIIATTSILQFMWAWNAFLVPLIFSITNPDIRTLGVGMYQFVGEFSVDWTGMAAAASISLIPIIVVFICFQRYFVEGVAGAVKG
ncbi:carbohydrate ABC transporter permease [Paenibacillus sp. JSM ZJ436]|uniref:carbohydrate ABC transporter permease n=1 Tax=Paenibacillus sp. JSM ZJ436 TaxID=3376190 RepID=UPI00379B0462